MSVLNRWVAAVGVVGLCVFAFLAGRYVTRLAQGEAVASYNALVIEGALRQLRAGQADHATIGLEARLDEDVATLAQTQRRGWIRRLCVPARYRAQGERAVAQFLAYRRGPGLAYAEAPLADLGRLTNAPPALIEELRRVNARRTRVNALVREVYAAHGGRTPAAPADGADGGSAPSGGGG